MMGLLLPPAYAAFSAYKAPHAAQTGTNPNAPAGVQRVSIQLKPKRQSIDIQPLLDSIKPIVRGQEPLLPLRDLNALCRRSASSSEQRAVIHARIATELQARVAELAREWRGSILGREEGWLGRLVGGWRVWQARADLLAAVFVYQDVQAKSSGTPKIQDLATSIFMSGIWDNQLIYQKTRDDLLNWVTDERSSDRIDDALRPTVIAVAGLTKALSVWETITQPYLELLKQYYSGGSDDRLAAIAREEQTPGEYVEWFLDSADAENERATTCFSPEVAGQAVKGVRACASRDVIPGALDAAMDQADPLALARLYKYSSDIQGFPQMASSLQAHIHNRLKTLIADPSNDARMIEESLKLKRFADSAVAGLFGDADDTASTSKEERARSSELRDAVHVGFKKGLGSRQNAPAEWIAKHLDEAMRKGQGSGTEAEFNTLLDEIIALVGFTPDKDVFKAFYSAQLAKRLLLGRSASDDMERNMILKLQREMGDEFTSGDIMMKDLQLSESLVKSYQTHLSKSDQSDPTSLSANVLTESAWPAYPLLKDGWAFKLPPQLQSSVDQFAAWYNVQHKNRQLSWRWQLATVTMVARFGGKRYEIGVSLFQAVVLMCFDEDDTLGFEAIKERTGIETGELQRTLQSLSLGRKGTRVLLKSTKTKEVAPTDKFQYNHAFTSDRMKFRINQIQTDLSAEESKATNEQVAIDRVSVLEATIVRIMKGKKKMTLQLLIDEVVRDVSKRFPPDVKEIKKRMESLIEREFLMRDDDDRNLLQYLA